MSESCANCRFFRAVSKEIREYDFIGSTAYTKATGKFETVTQCRRRAPISIFINGQVSADVESRWPVVDAAEWCGEYAAKENA